MTISQSKLIRMAIFAYAAFCLLWFGAQFFTMARDAVNDQLTLRTQDNRIEITEFFQSYLRAKIGCSDHKEKIFDPDVQLPGASSSPIAYQMKIICSPLTLFVVAPFTFLRASLAQITFESVSIVLSVIGIVALATAAVDSKRRLMTALLVSIGMLATYPAMANVYVGQEGLLELVGAALFFAAWWQKKDIWAGLFLVIAAIKFQYLPFLMIAPLVKMRWKVIASFAIAAALTIAAMAIWCPPCIFQYLPQLIHNDAAVGDQASEWMICIRGLWFHLVPRTYAIALSLLSTLGGLLYLGWLWKISDITNKTNQALLISATILIALVFSPHSYSVDMVMLAVPGVMLVPLLLAPNGLARNAFFKTYFWLICLFPIATWLIYKIPAPEMPWASLHITELYAYLPYNAIMLYCLLKAGRIVSNKSQT